jgi:hypothetical protein
MEAAQLRFPLAVQEVRSDELASDRYDLQSLYSI